MNFAGYHWFMEEEKKREERMKANHLSILNRELQILIKELKYKIDWKKYKKVANRLEHEYRVVQSSLWNLTWMNNFESADVAVAQGLLINTIIKNEEIVNKVKYDNQLNGLMKRLGNIDWSAYLKYGQMKNRI